MVVMANKNLRQTYFSEGIRESMACLPKFLQPIITLLTGKPLPREKPFFVFSPMGSLISSFTSLIVLVCIGFYFLSITNYIFLVLPIYWVIITGIMRKLQVVYGHHLIHGMFSLRISHFIMDFITTILLVQNRKLYKYDHMRHHSKKFFTTLEDADALSLFKLGFSPGRKVSFYFRKLLTTIISPKFHGKILISRIKSNLSRSLMWSFLSVFWLIFITIGLGLIFPLLHVVVLIWLPLFVFLNISSLLQFLTEHAWLITRNAPTSDIDYNKRCWGRFLGEKYPSGNIGSVRLFAVLKWWSRMILVHLPVRVGCLVGDLPAHDWHHLSCFIRNGSMWTTAIYNRQQLIDIDNSLKMDERELWGLYDMLTHVFMLLSNSRKYDQAIV